MDWAQVLQRFGVVLVHVLVVVPNLRTIKTKGCIHPCRAKMGTYPSSFRICSCPFIFFSFEEKVIGELLGFGGLASFSSFYHVRPSEQRRSHCFLFKKTPKTPPEKVKKRTLLQLIKHIYEQSTTINKAASTTKFTKNPPK